MFTHIHTIHWNHVPEASLSDFNYFKNALTEDSYIVESKAPGGFEYYYCTEVQMKNKTCGSYIGCISSDAEFGKDANILVYDHDNQTEKTLSLNDEIYL